MKLHEKTKYERKMEEKKLVILKRMDYKEFREYAFRALNISSDEELVAIVKKKEQLDVEQQQITTECESELESESKTKIVVRQVKEYLVMSENAREKEEKKYVALKIYDYLLGRLWFLRNNQGFCKASLKKLNEFYLERNFTREEYEKYFLPMSKCCSNLESSLYIVDESVTRELKVKSELKCSDNEEVKTTPDIPQTTTSSSSSSSSSSISSVNVEQSAPATNESSCCIS